MRESECKGEGAAWTLEHLPGRTATRSCPERRRAAVRLQHVSVRPCRVGTRRWCGGDSCHGRHAHPHGTQVGNRPQCDSAVVRLGRKREFGKRRVAPAMPRSACVLCVGRNGQQGGGADDTVQPPLSPQVLHRLPRLPAGADLAALCARPDRCSARLPCSRYGEVRL
jgi:hypothetical protein